MIDPTILRWHRLENMESVSSCSPPSSSDDNMTRSLPSASTNRADPGRLFQLARSEMLAMQTKDAVAARDDERDDALVANKRSEGQIRLLHDTMQPMVHEGGSLTDSDDRNLAERRYVDAMHCDYPMWHRSSGWFPSRSHALVSSRSYHLYDRVRRNGMVPLLQEKPHAPRPIKSTHYGPLGGTSSGFTRVVSSQWPRDNRSQSRIPRTSSARGGRTSFAPNYSSRVVIPSDIIIPKEITTSSRDAISPAEESIGKRSNSDSSNSSPSPSSAKRVKTHSKPLEGRFDKLDLLCSATLELGPLQDNPTGCSCPKSKCIALYCDCFKAGTYD